MHVAFLVLLAFRWFWLFCIYGFTNLAAFNFTFDCFGHLGHSKSEKTEKSKVKQTSITVA
jgi:hypothetical protein